MRAVLCTALLIAGPLAAQAPAAVPAPGGPPSTSWTTDQHITAAVLPLPEGLRAKAAVYAWRERKLVQLRAGTNSMMCLAEDPARKNFHVACYHRDLEPFMAAGRERTAKGLSRTAVDSARLADIKARKWAMPARPTALYELFAPEGAYDPAAGVLTGGSPVYVLYTPYATEASLGVVQDGLKGGQPWLMNPGEPWAHLMITP